MSYFIEILKGSNKFMHYKCSVNYHVLLDSIFKSIVVVVIESHYVAHADPKLLTSSDHAPAPDAGTVCMSPYLTSGFKKNLKNYVYFMCMGVLLECMSCAPCVHNAYTGQKRAAGFLKLELQMAESCHVGVGN